MTAASPANERTKVMLAYGNAIFRRGLRSALEPEFLVCETPSGADALLVAAEERPDVVVLMPDAATPDPAATAQTLMETVPHLNVLGIWPTDATATVIDAIAVGVRGFILKTDEPYTVPEAVRALRDGNVYLSPAMARQILGVTRHFESLTPRQRAVFRLLAKGKESPQIAQELNISERTVTSYLTQIHARSGVQTRRVPVAVRARDS